MIDNDDNEGTQGCGSWAISSMGLFTTCFPEALVSTGASVPDCYDIFELSVKSCELGI